MNALHILFKTNRFNLSKVGDHFINPCCFGEDLAAWLRVKLIERKIAVPRLYQEDWGWELQANRGPDSYYLCMSGNADGSSMNVDEGERVVASSSATRSFDSFASRRASFAI